jgi:Holliday junction resolvasome RuvABC endonuclease subunit
MKEYIIGIDPGITQSAACLFEHDFPSSGRVLDYTAPFLNHAEATWIEKVKILTENILEFDFTDPVKVAIEKPIVRPFGTKLVDQFLFVGAIIHAMSMQDLPIYLVNPNTVKLALSGSGTSKKPAMVKSLLTMEEMGFVAKMRRPEREAIADSVGIAMAVAKKLNGVERLC